MDPGMMMPSRVRDIAGDGQGRRNRRARQQAVTKPETGFGIHRCHLVTPSLNASPRKAAPHSVCCSGTVYGALKPDFSTTQRGRRTPPQLGRYPNNTVKQVRKTQLRNG
jgi:hypothetical protein